MRDWKDVGEGNITFSLDVKRDIDGGGGGRTYPSSL